MANFNVGPFYLLRDIEKHGCREIGGCETVFFYIILIFLFYFPHTNNSHICFIYYINITCKRV